MRCRRVTYHFLIAAALTFAVSQMPHLISPARAGEKAAPKPKDRAQSVRAIASHLGLGEGSVIADIGAGNGRDTWVFAAVVGETGTVHPEEIGEKQVNNLKAEAKKRGLSQVRPVIGRSDDPCLPRDSADLVYMNHVYHHFAKPRPMLRGIWRGLKPGGHLVIVDRELGTLRNWVERKLRESKHWWIAETTVVREAREEGFKFVDCAEQCWHDRKEFVLVFERPEGVEKPGSDPDAFLPVPADKCSGLLCPIGCPYHRPVFVALGQTRELMAPILESSSGGGLEIVLEEWATQKDERPPLPGGVSLPSVLTDLGNPNLPDEQVDVVFFLDSYHLLFHGKTLLAKLHEKLSPNGCVYVLDRTSDELMSRREASHRRKIQPRTVRQEMAEAGFHLLGHGPRPARDRFLLVFGKAPAGKTAGKEDPLVGGPAISERPGQWLRQNLWRLRGLKTVDGSFVPLNSTGRRGRVKSLDADSAAVESWSIPKEKLALSFRKKGDTYVLIRVAPLAESS